MQGTDLKVFSGLMASLGEIYGKELSQILIEIYWQSLREFDLLEVRQAFKAHVSNPDGGQFFPKPADFIRVIEGSFEGRTLEAWTQVQWTMGSVGAYQSVVFDDPLIHAVIEDMGGWIALCAITLKELPFKALDFQKRYRALLHKPPKRHPPYLTGIIERDNAREGYRFPPPVVIGDLRKAQVVMGTGTQKTFLVHAPYSESMRHLVRSISSIQRKPEPDHE